MNRAAVLPFLVFGCFGKDNREHDSDDAGTDADCIHCEGSFDIENAFDLEQVTPCDTITGLLVVRAQGWLTDFQMPCLSTVGESLTIADNATLIDFDLSELSSIGTFGSISTNDSLGSLEGLSGLATIGDYLTIEDNNSLTTLGMSSLQYVSGNLIIYRNDVLTSLNLPKLNSAGGQLQIYSNDSLCQADAEAFAASIDVGGDIYVEDNGSARTDCD